MSMLQYLKKIPATYLSAYSGLPGRIWLLSLVVLVNHSGSMVLFFLSLYLTRKLHYSITEAGRAISVYGFGTLIGAFLGGWLSDRVGTYRVQLSSLLLAGLVFITLGYLKSYSSILIMLFILAIIADTFRPANITAIANYCPKEKIARGFAMNRLAANLGVAIGPTVGGFLATLNYRYLFWVDGLTCILAGTLFYFLFKVHSKRNYQPASPDSVIISPYKDRIFLILLGLTFIIGMIFFQLFSTWPFFLKEHYALIEDQVGTLIGINGILIVVIEMPLIHRLEKRNIMKVIQVGILFLFGGFSLIGLGNCYEFAILTVIIWTMGEILVLTLLATAVANRVSANNRGKYMGVYSFVFGAAFVVGPMIGTWLYSRFSPGMLWSAIGLSGILVWFGFQIVGKLEKRELRCQ